MSREDRPDVVELLTTKQWQQAVAEWLTKNRGLPGGEYHEMLTVVWPERLEVRIWRLPPPEAK